MNIIYDGIPVKKQGAKQFSIEHRNYFQTSKGHMTWIIWKINSIPTHYGVAYESVPSHAIVWGHMNRVWVVIFEIFSCIYAHGRLDRHCLYEWVSISTRSQICMCDQERITDQERVKCKNNKFLNLFGYR